MPTIIEAVRQYIVATIVPFITSSLVTWAASAHVLAVLSLSPTSAAKAVSAALVFVVTWIANQLLLHKILAGHFTPAAKEAAVPTGSRRLP